MSNTSKQRTRKYEFHITLAEEKNREMNEWVQMAYMSRMAFARNVLFERYLSLSTTLRWMRRCVSKLLASSA